MREMKDSGVEWIGEIPKEKSLLRNKFLFKYEKGKIPVSTNTENRGKPYIGATDLDSLEGYSLYTEDDDIPEVYGDELLVLWDGARAGIAGTHKVGKISSTIVKISGGSGVYQPFLYWYYMGFVEFMMDMVNGTTIPHMNRKYIEDIGFISWSLHEQRKLTEYLESKCSKIDEIIAKQEQIIEKLNEYKISRINEIVVCKDGIKCNLGLISTMKNGLNFSDTSEGSRICFLGVGDFKDYFFLTDKDQFSTIYIETAIQDDYLLKDGDIIFVRSNGSKELVGRAVMVSNIDYPLTYSGFCIRYRNIRKDLIDDEFLLYYFRSAHFRKLLEKYSQGSNINNVNQDLLSGMPFVIPSMNYQKKGVAEIRVLAEKVDTKVSNIRSMIDKLVQYKKSLIYEVVTGKKEV